MEGGRNTEAEEARQCTFDITKKKNYYYYYYFIGGGSRMREDIYYYDVDVDVEKD